MPELRAGATTDTGRIRPENEDAFVAHHPVFAVADGMGGHQAGEVASAIAVDTLRTHLGGDQAIESVDDLVTAVKAANLAIYEAAAASPERQGMGTTVTALSVLRDHDGNPTRLALANVGDSRAYVLRNGHLRQLSVDHSYVQDLVTTGQITKDEARTHPHRNIVTRALGIEPDVHVDAWTLPLVRGDRFLLCSDGLVDEVLEESIAELLGGVEDPQEAAEALVATANRHGGRDNTTVVVLDVLDGDEPPDDPLDLGLEPHWADGVPEAGEWRDDLRLDDTPPSTPSTMVLPATGGATGDPGDPPADTPTDTTQPISRARLATLVDDPEPASSTSEDDPREVPPPLPPLRRASRFNWRTFAFLFAIAAIVVAAFTMTAVYARSSYHVGFDGSQVVVYKGRPGRILWFQPTVAYESDKQRDDLRPSDIAQVEAEIEFESLAGAVNYLNELEPVTDPEPDAATTTTVAPTTTDTATTDTGTTVTTAPSAPGVTSGAGSG